MNLRVVLLYHVELFASGDQEHLPPIQSYIFLAVKKVPSIAYQNASSINHFVAINTYHIQHLSQTHKPGHKPFLFY